MKRLLKNKIKGAAHEYIQGKAYGKAEGLAFKAGAAFVIDNLWINKKEQMPETADSVLFLFNNMPVVGLPECLKMYDEIQYWMPIPQVPTK